MRFKPKHLEQYEAKQGAVTRGYPVVTQLVTPGDTGKKIRYGSLEFQRFYAGDNTEELAVPLRLIR
jgi:hypothetical protein